MPPSFLDPKPRQYCSAGGSPRDLPGLQTSFLITCHGRMCALVTAQLVVVRHVCKVADYCPEPSAWLVLIHVQFSRLLLPTMNEKIVLVLGQLVPETFRDACCSMKCMGRTSESVV